MKVTYTLRINGQAYPVEAPPQRMLLDVLRDHLGLYGTKEACREGECGACTVLVDGQAVCACITLAVAVAGREITTVEGLAAGDRLSPLQQAFAEHGAVQCGFCTPGFLLACTALLQENPAPTEQEIREAVAGNLCRCTGYNPIIAAVRAAAGQGGGQ